MPVVRGVRGGRVVPLRVGGHGGPVEEDAYAADQAVIETFVGPDVLETAGGEDASIFVVPFLALVGRSISPALSAFLACSPTRRSFVGDL